MKKLQLFIILLLVIVLFAYADYTMNVPEGIDLPNIPKLTEDEPAEPPVRNYPNVTQGIIEAAGLSQGMKIEKRTRTTELFETFDLGQVANTVAFNNVVVTTQDTLQPLFIYEIHGPEGQGKITYLNIKLRMIDQIGSSAGINETGTYGFNSLFYNDEGNPNTGFLISQIGDMVFGFKYNKNSNVFDSVKQFVEYYMSAQTN